MQPWMWPLFLWGTGLYSFCWILVIVSCLSRMESSADLTRSMVSKDVRVGLPAWAHWSYSDTMLGVWHTPERSWEECLYTCPSITKDFKQELSEEPKKRHRTSSQWGKCLGQATLVCFFFPYNFAPAWVVRMNRVDCAYAHGIGSGYTLVTDIYSYWKNFADDLVSKCTNTPGGPVELLSRKHASKFLPTWYSLE